MSNAKFFNDIKRLLEQNGAMGVNALAKELSVPVSTLQKYLDRDQNYFKKNHSRKWVLPEALANSDMSVVSSNYSSVVDSQLLSMQALIDTLMAQFRATMSLIDANKGTSTAVAGIAPDVDKMMVDSDKRIKDTLLVFKKYISKCPEEYQDLIKNLDLYRITIEMGTKYMNEVINPEITSLFLEKTVDLSNTVQQILKDYQKETK